MGKGKRSTKKLTRKAKDRAARPTARSIKRAVKRAKRPTAAATKSDQEGRNSRRSDSGIARQIDELSRQVVLAVYEFLKARKSDSAAPNESLNLRHRIGKCVNYFKGDSHHGTDAVGRLADLLEGRYSTSYLGNHARLATLPGEVIDGLAKEGRSWRWVLDNMSVLKKEGQKNAPHDVEDLEF